MVSIYGFPMLNKLPYWYKIMAESMKESILLAERAILYTNDLTNWFNFIINSINISFYDFQKKYRGKKKIYPITGYGGIYEGKHLASGAGRFVYDRFWFEHRSPLHVSLQEAEGS